MDTFYVITARNRLSGMRERISGKMTRQVAQEKVAKLVMQRNAPYTYPKIVPYDRRLFKD